MRPEGRTSQLSYLFFLLFNIFVFPIAWGGNILFDGKELNPDTYSLLIPQFFNNNILTVLVFLGGFSAAISMIIVSSIALATMLSNNLLIPYGFIGSLENLSQEKNNSRIVKSRKIGIFFLIILKDLKNTIAQSSQYYTEQLIRAHNLNDLFELSS